MTNKEIYRNKSMQKIYHLIRSPNYNFFSEMKPTNNRWVDKIIEKCV